MRSRKNDSKTYYYSWKKSNRSTDREKLIFQEIYSVLEILSKFPQELRANYIATGKRSDVRLFHLDQNNLLDLLQIGDDESCRLEFYSSLIEENSASISIDVGNNDDFFDTVVIGLPLSLNAFDPEGSELIKRLFSGLVTELDPFWGCVSNRMIARNLDSYLDGNLPNAVFWLNYWCKTMQNAIGMLRIKKATRKFAETYFDNGLFCMKDTALDAESISDMKYLRQVERCLRIGV